MEHRGNKKILKEGKMELIAMVMRMIIGTVGKTKKKMKRPRRRRKLQLKYSVRRDMNVWKLREELTTDRT